MITKGYLKNGWQQRLRVAALSLIDVDCTNLMPKQRIFKRFNSNWQYHQSSHNHTILIGLTQKA